MTHGCVLVSLVCSSSDRGFNMLWDSHSKRVTYSLHTKLLHSSKPLHLNPCTPNPKLCTLKPCFTPYLQQQRPRLYTPNPKELQAFSNITIAPVVVPWDIMFRLLGFNVSRHYIYTNIYEYLYISIHPELPKLASSQCNPQTLSQGPKDYFREYIRNVAEVSSSTRT